MLLLHAELLGVRRSLVEFWLKLGDGCGSGWLCQALGLGLRICADIIRRCWVVGVAVGELECSSLPCCSVRCAL